MGKCILLVLLFGVWAGPPHVNAQAVPASSTDPNSGSTLDPTEADDSPGWLFPIDRLDESLPRWLRIGGEYRNRLEGPTGIGFAATKDFTFWTACG